MLQTGTLPLSYLKERCSLQIFFPEIYLLTLYRLLSNCTETFLSNAIRILLESYVHMDIMRHTFLVQECEI